MFFIELEMSSFSKMECFSAWNKHTLVDSDRTIAIREASVSKRTEELVFGLFECREVEIQEAVVFVAVSQQDLNGCRRRVYTVGVRIGGDSLSILEDNGRITVQPRLRRWMEDFQYVRHDSGVVIRGKKAPVDALFDDDRSVTSVEQYFRSPVDGRVVSQNVADCVGFHSFLKSGQEKSGCSGWQSVVGNGSGRKRSMHDDEDQACKKGRIEMPVSCIV